MRKVVIIIGLTMASAYVLFLLVPYFENMYYYGTPTSNFTKIAHDLFMKKYHLNPEQKKIFLQQEQNKTNKNKDKVISYSS